MASAFDGCHFLLRFGKNAMDAGRKLMFVFSEKVFTFLQVSCMLILHKSPENPGKCGDFAAGKGGLGKCGGTNGRDRCKIDELYTIVKM